MHINNRSIGVPLASVELIAQVYKREALNTRLSSCRLVKSFLPVLVCFLFAPHVECGGGKLHLEKNTLDQDSFQPVTKVTGGIGNSDKYSTDDS